MTTQTPEALAIAGLVMSASTLAMLVQKRALTAVEGREVIDRALLLLEQTSAQMPPADHSALARGLLEAILQTLPPAT